MIVTNTWEAVGAIAFVELPSATLGGYTTESGIIIVPDPTKRLEEIAAVDGTIVAVGERFGLQVKAGDKVAVNYRLTSDFTQDEDGSPLHKRCYIVDGKLVWKADPLHIMAVLRDGKWQALGDWVIMKPIEEPNPRFKDTTLIIPDNAKTIIALGRGTFISGDIDAPEGCTLCFDHPMKSVYTFPDQQEYWLINKNHIDGYLN